jgi:hypothetical protein
MLAASASDSTLVLRLIAAKGDAELLIATYLFLRSQTSASIATVDGTMSDLIQSASPDMYASFWQAARGSAAGGSLLSLLLSNTREGELAFSPSLRSLLTRQDLARWSVAISDLSSPVYRLELETQEYCLLCGVIGYAFPRCDRESHADSTGDPL